MNWLQKLWCRWRGHKYRDTAIMVRQEIAGLDETNEIESRSVERAQAIAVCLHCGAVRDEVAEYIKQHFSQATEMPPERVAAFAAEMSSQQIPQTPFRRKPLYGNLEAGSPERAVANGRAGEVVEIRIRGVECAKLVLEKNAQIVVRYEEAPMSTPAAGDVVDR